MKSWNEIKQMNQEEIAAENKKLMKRLVLTKIVAPIAITAVVHFGLNYLCKKLDDTNED